MSISFRFLVRLAALFSALAPGAVPASGPDWEPVRRGPALGTDVELASPIATAVGAVAGAEPAQWTADVDPLAACVGAPAMYPDPACVQPMCVAPGYGATDFVDLAAGPPTDPAFWQWRVLPDGVVWQSYWAGVHEPRISGVAFADQEGTALLDVALGGRAALLRYGTDGPGRPQGAELQIEGAAFPRLTLDENWDLEATDFRFGLPLVYGRDLWQVKFSYYHLSSHLGDERAIREDSLDERINFSRDCLALGLSAYVFPAVRLYSEAAWAFHYDVSEPWEFQFGADVAQPGATGALGTPFVAINGHIREEVDYGGNVVFQAGWLWRGNNTNTLRVGFHYFNGKSSQFEFFDRFEEQLGGGVWYDF